MKIKKQFLAALCLFFTVIVNGTLSAQTTPAAPVKLTSVEGITEYKLANGLHVLLFPDQSNPKITVNVTYKVGSRMEGYGETGMAHLLEHMMFKGSKNHPNIDQELTAHGADNNASTDYDRTNYFETLTATDENLKWALALESDRMVNSFIAQKDLNSEFTVVRNEFEMGENYPSSILLERVMSTAYLWHNYGKAVIGSKEDIEKVPAANLHVFYHKYYQPDNAVLLVAGKIDEAKTLALINQYFGKIPKPTRVLEEPYTSEPAQDGERECVLRRVGDAQVASCGYHICSASHPDFASLVILNQILTDEPSGRLYKALVDTKKATGLWGYAFPLKDPGYMYFSADVLKDKPLMDTKQAMLNLLDSLQYNPVTQEEVDRARNSVLKNYELNYNNTEKVGLFMSEYIAQGDWRLMFLYRDRVEKVTVDDVNRVVKEYFKPSNRTVGLFIPEAAPDRTQVPATPDVSTMVKDYKGKEKLEEAENFDPSCDNIDKRTKTGSIPGGGKYAFLNKTTRGHSVIANITLRIGNQNDLKNKSTLADLTASMLMKGTTTRTEQQINDALDKLKAKVDVYGGGQAVQVHIETINKNLVEVLKLVTDVLRHPAFPAPEFDKLIQEDLAGIDQQKSEPQSLAANEFGRVTNPYDKDDFRYSMTFDEQSAAAKNAKLDDVKKFYSDFYNSANATVAVVGDFDPTAVSAELNTMLQNWASPVKYTRAENKYFDVAAKLDKINTPDKANAMLMAGFNLQMNDRNADYVPLLMGNFMLGGGFLNSRLANRIRNKDGLSYGVGSWVTADPIDQSGGFGSYAIYNPKNSDKLIADYKEEIQKVLDSGFTETELKDARSGFLQERKGYRSKDDYLANRLSENLFLGRTFQVSKDIDDKITALTLNQVNTAMRKWIKPEKITYIQAGDFEKKQ